MLNDVFENEKKTIKTIHKLMQSRIFKSLSLKVSFTHEVNPMAFSLEINPVAFSLEVNPVAFSQEITKKKRVFDSPTTTTCQLTTIYIYIYIYIPLSV